MGKDVFDASFEQPELTQLGTPVIIFINKMDREGRDPFDLLDELEQELKISVRPLSWPINQGAKFKGVYNIYEQKLDLFTPDKQRVTEKIEVDISSTALDEQVGERDAQQLRDDLELVDGVYPEFQVDTYRSAEVAPVFFGSALNNFGVQELLNCFVEIAPSPRPTKAEERMVCSMHRWYLRLFSMCTFVFSTTAHSWAS